ncbi:VCBS domain-containing protein, partial [uncultured Desulfovibrio sp.]|uniref:Ig-like domain-containing protein n=1 Tax=uncultured Desulfovibrio sp. TaxID=167968 RepID=UPI00262C44C1
MADIRLAKPAAGTTQTVPSAPDGRFIFDFPADAATLTRSGDNLVLTFEDGASIQLQDFYTTYSKEEMPSFQVEGVEISGQDFFAALGEDLMPAAGPAAGSSASRSGRYNEYGGSDLLDGLDHLGRLDIGFDGGVQLATDTVEPSPYYEDDHGVTVTPSAPGTDPDDPDIPVQGEDFPPTMPHDVLQVDESALDGGSGGGSATADGSMSVSAPDGVATITIGGVVVWQNGALTGNPVQTDEGHLDVTGFDGTNLTYTYTLDKATQEHGKEGGGENDAIAHEMEVVVTDSDGDSGSAVIRVEITDDVPVAYDDMNSLTEVAESVSGNVLDNDESGADGWRTDADGNIAAVVLSGSADGTYGMLTLNADGSYTYTRNETGVPDDGAEDTFTYIAYDADGDAVEKTLTITIENTDPTAPGGEGHTLTVTLSDADAAGENTDTANQSVDLFDGPEAFTSAVFGSTENIVVSGGESFTWSQSEGKLIGTGSESGAVVTLEITGITPDGTVTVSATLDDPAHHNDGSNSLNISGIVITATDAGGSTVSGTMNVVVTDDTATGQDDVNSLAEEAESVSGNVLENDKSGADGWRMDGEGNVAAVELSGSADGTYGTLTLNADGSYTYTRNETGVPDDGAEDTFTYIAYDADGDAVEKTLTITIENTDPTAPGGEGHTLTVTLSDADAAGENTDTANQSVDLFDGPEAFTSAVFGSTENIVVSGGESFTWSQSEGKLIGTGSESGAVVTLEITGITPDGTVTVSATLDDPAHHNDGSNSLNISGIVITATDAGGSTVSGTMNVVVTDDTATGQDDVNRLAEEAESVSGNVLENDESGADGWRMDGEGNVAAVELSSSADGMYGTLMLNADGSYTYTRNGTGVPDGGASDTFTYIAYDADGDAVEKTLTITIENTDPTAPGGEGHTLTVTLSDADAAG